MSTRLAFSFSSKAVAWSEDPPIGRLAFPGGFGDKDPALKIEGSGTRKTIASKSRGILEGRPKKRMQGFGWLVFEAQGADFGQQRFVGDAEPFRCARFVPLRFAEGVLYLEALDVRYGALRHLLERPFP